VRSTTANRSRSAALNLRAGGDQEACR